MVLSTITGFVFNGSVIFKEHRGATNPTPILKVQATNKLLKHSFKRKKAEKPCTEFVKYQNATPCFRSQYKMQFTFLTQTEDCSEPSGLPSYSVSIQFCASVTYPHYILCQMQNT